MRTLGIGRGPGRRFRGASLTELLVALALFGIVGAATLRSLDRQARFHSGMLAILESRSQHAAAHEAVATELRGASTAAGDVPLISDSSIVFRLPVGAGVACDITTGTIDLAPDSVSAGQAFARFRTSPQPGDTAWIFDEGATDTAADDAWVGLPVAAATRAPGHCPGSPLRDPIQDAGLSSWRLALAGAAPPSTVTPGSAVRLTRMARFALYRGGTGEHWLGFAEAQPATGSWISIQPVSGPYLPFNAAAPSASGMALGSRDSSGAALAGPGTPAAISMATRTRTTRVVRMDGVARGRYADSLHSLIGLRNSR
jgi:prepilin-type N-terminal cleavage/methylation domain-containing protein